MKINIVNHSLISYREKGIASINPASLKQIKDNTDLFDENL